MREFVFSFEPWGREMSVVADSEKEARQVAWTALPDFYKNNCESFYCVEENSALPEQKKGVSSTQFRNEPV